MDEAFTTATMIEDILFFAPNHLFALHLLRASFDAGVINREETVKLAEEYIAIALSGEEDQ